MAAIDDTSTDKLTPIKPHPNESGMTVAASTRKLINVTIETYSCFPTAKNNADVEPDMPRITPNTINILRNGTIPSHFSPNASIIISEANTNTNAPNNMLNMLIKESDFKNAFLSLFLSCLIFT